MLKIKHYTTDDGRDLVKNWIRNLRDLKAKAAIIRRLNRMEQGNPGDYKSLGGGLFELRIDTGPGYRIYFTKEEGTVLLLFCGGEKGTQQADIKRAHAFLIEWKKQHKNEVKK